MINLVNNLKIAPFSYRFASDEDIKNSFYTAKCDKCGWWGSSKFLNGGGQIADTGDYADSCCPVCGNVDVAEKDMENETFKDETEFELKKGDYVRAAKDRAYDYQPMGTPFVFKGKKYKVVDGDGYSSHDDEASFEIIDANKKYHLFHYNWLNKKSENYLFDKVEK